MARYEKSRPKRPKPHVAVAPARTKRAPAPVHYEDAMFFPRLRRQAKWVFVFLAVVFGLGFVGFGVGAGGVGVGDIFRDAGGGSAESVSDAREKTEDRPRDPQAWRDLATALETEGETGEAIEALDRAVELDAADATSLRQLAGLHLSLATERQREAQLAQVVAAYRAPSQSFPGLVGSSGQAVLDDPIGSAVTGSLSGRVQSAYQAASAETTLAVNTYKRLGVVQPDDPNVQLELAQAAQQAGDTVTAIEAFERFLKLAPDDPSAGIVREQLKQLRASTG